MTDSAVPDPGPQREAISARPRMSRRALLGAAAAGTAGLVAGRLAGPLFASSRLDPSTPAASESDGSGVHPYFGDHQAGISTPLQGHLHFAAFDMLVPTDRRDLEGLLRDWSAAAARMTQGLTVVGPRPAGSDPDAPQDDTGEALGLPASRLTVTIGLGLGLFERDGVDRYGIAAARPPDLRRLPSFDGDRLDAAWCDGDLAIQACADDPQVAVHAVRNLARIAAGRAAIRWSQLGFSRTSTTSTDDQVEQTPRNLMGFKDGTNNILGSAPAIVDQHVWLPSTSSPSWLAGGTYLIVRKIAVLIEDWDRLPLVEQQASVGRAKASGAPLSGGGELTPPDFEATIDGVDAIDRAAHVRLAHPSNNGGIRILRRGYNYMDGNDARGCLDAGLLFISYQRSPRQFIAIQRALASDRLNEFLRHIGSAMFVVPPGASAGGFVGETLPG